MIVSSRQLHDLDELSQRVLNRVTRQYVEEAILSYRAGAHRAAIGAVWVAVCADIIEKIRELASLGDAEAKTKSEKFDIILKSGDTAAMMDFERDLLEVACGTLELISNSEKRGLERIKEDRNKAVHPSFHEDGSHLTFLPEVTRTHIVTACLTLFSVPATKGKVVVDGIFALICEDSFPRSVDDAYKVLYSRSHLERAKDATIRNLIIVLLKRLFVDPDSIPQNLVEAIVAALGAIERIKPDLTKDVLTEKLASMLSGKSDTILRRLVAVLSMIPTYWSRVDLALKIRVRGVIEALEPSDIIKYRVIKVAENIPELQSVVIGLVSNMKPAERRKIISSRPTEYLIPLAIDEFSRAGSFDSANTLAKAIIIPFSSLFKTADLDNLFKSIDANQKTSINQIYSASETDAAFADLAKSSLGQGQSARDLWERVYAEYSFASYEFDLLRAELEKQGVLEVVTVSPAETMADEDIPF